MRLGIVIGLVLLALGGWIASGNATYKTKKAAVDIGVLQANVREEHQIPKWIGFASLGAGVLVLLASAKRTK
ncbi:MAG TPA: hypothetical protein VGQ24_08920 [Gemmatimonadales bacterium]|nr:hypothetical protein [Gemmatimonadales bacterium]